MINIPYSILNLERIISDGNDKLQQEHREREAAKAGVLRGGNSGCITADGDVYGTCSRKSLARLLGFDTKPGYHNQFYFDNGGGIEEVLYPKLKASWKGIVLREEEAQIEWKVGERSVTGRPDFLLCDTEGNPELGIELKTICSTNMANQIWYDVQPKTEHLCQAAHYMWQKNCSWTLMYYSASNYLADNWKVRKYKLKWGTKIKPFRRVFNLTFKDDVLWYTNVETGQEVETKIRATGIQEYYQLIDEMANKKVLGPRVASKYPDGRDLPYNLCKYCEFAEACDNYEQTTNFDTWTDILASIIKGENA